MKNSGVSDKRHRFPQQIISNAVWLCFRFPLSLRLVEEMLLARGMVVSYETIHHLAKRAPSRHDNSVIMVPIGIKAVCEEKN